jgi:hypothetical protein
MDTFAILGFFFGMLAFLMASGANSELSKVKKELAELRKSVPPRA